MNLTDKELIEFSKKHLFYEVWMFLEVSKIENSSEQVLKNIIIESFVIHLRNLITFLYPTKSIKLTDVYAKDFFSNPEKWEKFCPLLSETLKKARERAHKEVGHITTERIAEMDDPEKPWEKEKFVNEIVPIIKLFCKEADNSKLDNSILKLLN